MKPLSGWVKCPKCGGWDTIKEFRIEKEELSQQEKPIFVSEEDLPEERIILGINEMDRVLGGGITRAVLPFFLGRSGIGKTTLCFEIASKMVELGFDALYVSGEESLRQLSSRKKRLHLKGFLSNTCNESC